MSEKSDGWELALAAALEAAVVLAVKLLTKR